MSVPESILYGCDSNEQLLERLVNAGIMTIPESDDFRQKAASGEDTNELMSSIIGRYTNGHKVNFAAAYVRRHKIKAGHQHHNRVFANSFAQDQPL